MSAPLSIATLNDAFRVSFVGGQVLLTPGIAALEEADQLAILAAVQAFDRFTPDNDPYGEHDFGAIEHPRAGKVFWKIDYYDPTMTAGSDDPADTRKTQRVLTIMLASEY